LQGTAPPGARERVLAELELALRELEDAEALLRRLEPSRRAYIGFEGRLMIEVTVAEALDYVEERKAGLKALLEKLRKETPRGEG